MRPGDILRAELNRLYQFADASDSEATFGAIIDMERIIRRLARKIERLDGNSLATEDAHSLVDFDSVPNVPVEIVET